MLARPQGPAPIALLVVAAALAAAAAAAAEGWARYAALLAGLLAVAAAAMLLRERRRAPRAQQEFATAFAHHARTPLAHIRLYNEMLLLGRARSEEEMHEWLEIIDREVNYLGGLVDNLVIAAQPPRADEFPNRRRVDLGTLAEDVAADYAGRAAAQGMNIVVDPPAGLVAQADPEAVRRALGNLLDNAIRHGAQGQRILVDLSRDGDEALLCVADEGPGLPVALARGAAEHRSRRPSDPPPTAGFGLAAAWRIARAHGGRAFFAPMAGPGARACLALPLGPAALAAEPHPAPAVAERR